MSSKLKTGQRIRHPIAYHQKAPNHNKMTNSNLILFKLKQGHNENKKSFYLFIYLAKVFLILKSHPSDKSRMKISITYFKVELNLIMVKGYDPTTTDPSKIILEYLLRWSSSSNPLTLQQAQAYTKHWLKNSDSTAKVYQSFEGLDIQSKRKPEIILRKSCRNFMNWSYWRLILRSQ